MKRIAAYGFLLGCGLVAGAFALLHLRPGTEGLSPELTSPDEREAGAGLRFVFFGTSSVLLSDGTTALLTDGFFSRPSWLRLLTRFEPDTDAIEFALSHAPRKIDALFVAHSHHDHAMDSGVVARRTGAVLHGSPSTLNIARGQDIQESQLRVLKVGEPLAWGAFRVTAFETPHSPRPITPGVVDHPLHPPSTLWEYRMAENFSFFVEHPRSNVLIVPSANYKPHTFDGLRADIVVLGIGSLGKQSAEFTAAYWDETVKRTGAKWVIPVHWDDFTTSLRQPLVAMPYVMDNVGVSIDRLRLLARRDGVEIRFAPALREVTLPTAH